MHLRRQLLALSRHVAGPVGVGVGVGLLLVGATVARGLLVAGALAAVLLDGRPARELWGTLAALAIAQAARSTLLWVREESALRIGAQVKVRLRELLVTRLLALGPEHAAAQRAGRLQALLVDGVEGLEVFFARYVPQVVVTAVAPTAIVVAITVADPFTGLLLLAFVVAVPVLPRLWDRLLVRRADEYWEQFRELNADYVEAMQQMVLLIAFGAADRRHEALRRRSAILLRATMRQMSLSLVSTATSGTIATAGVACTVAVGALRVASGDLDPRTLLVVLLLAGECFRPFADLASYWHSSYLGVAAAHGITGLLEDDAPPALTSRATVPHAGRTAVDLTGVVVCWPGRERPALDGLDLHVADGEVVGLVGPSGAGKSTVLAVLTALVRPISGRVVVAGHDLSALDPRQVRSLVVLVPQHPVLLAGSIAENIRLGRPAASDRDVAAAAAAAGLAPLLARLPTGLATRVGDRGGRLSGGERQRVALARALLLDPPVLALDEVTSAVDDATERAIVDGVAALRRGRTTLVVAHRPGALAHVDRVVEVRAGRAADVAALRGGAS